MSRIDRLARSRAVAVAVTVCLTACGGARVPLAARGVDVQTVVDARQDSLAGTSWRLVRFEGGDDTVLTPDDRNKYTLEFDATGHVAARIDCNRGRGTWTSKGASQLQLGSLALTRARCPPGSMHDQIVKQWSNVRSYVIKDGHLYLWLVADGGIYELEPAGAGDTSFTSPVPPRGPTTWTCTQGAATPDTLRATFYPTEPGLVLLERGGVTKPAFQVRAASGARYEGDGVQFWEARGQATLHWLGAELTCTPSS